jgi:hypothetical protein
MLVDLARNDLSHGHDVQVEKIQSTIFFACDSLSKVTGYYMKKLQHASCC